MLCATRNNKVFVLNHSVNKFYFMSKVKSSNKSIFDSTFPLKRFERMLFLLGGVRTKEVVMRTKRLRIMSLYT